jgi:predicted esterase
MKTLHQAGPRSRVHAPAERRFPIRLLATGLLLNSGSADAATRTAPLPLPGEMLEVDSRPAFVILPSAEHRLPNRPMPWVWYAPTLPNLPGNAEQWLFARLLTNGIAIAGIDVGESYGSPRGRAHYAAFHRELAERHGFSRKPCLLARSRGGLMLYNWAIEHPESVAGIAGIYPVCNLGSYPGLDKACGAYNLSATELAEQLAHHNPIERLAPLARARVPLFHIHGDSDTLVPLEANTAALAGRYRELGGSIRLRIPKGQGHSMWPGFFQCQELLEFLIARASPAAEREPSPALFMDPPMEARPGAFWSWMNGDVDLDRLTFELEEMKAKGMSGAEIWDIGVIRKLPDESIPAGPAFLGPESLKAVNHAIDQADRLGLHLGMVASSSWNAGGSWVKPHEAMKELYCTEITVHGPASLSERLPFPATRAPKGEDGLPLYHREVAVLAFQEAASNTIAAVAAVTNLSSRMDRSGLLTWEVPAGRWVIQRFVSSMTGEHLKVPSPNSNGLLIDHLDAKAAESHFRHILDQILTMRPSLDALRYMEVDSVEVGRGEVFDWTETFVEEFRRRRGYDPVPHLPALKGKSFSDPQLSARFRHDYRLTVSDLWIDGHYRASTRFLNTHGVQLVAEAGHGGYPRTEPLEALGVVDIPRGEFWNGRQFWVVKEAAAAAHIYGLQLVDAEAFTGWRSWQDGPLEYKRLADTAFCDGLNRITFHTFTHTPPHGGLPGHIYHAGEHFNVNNTWWNQSGPMLAYFSRCCYLLQQGLPVGDVCYYYGETAPNLVATRRIGPDAKRLDGEICAHCQRPNPAPADALGFGYDYDVMDSTILRSRLEVRDGRLVLPHGVSYAALVLPERDDMPLPVLERLESLVRDGATVLGPKPSRAPSLAGYPGRDAEVRSLAERLWGSGQGAEASVRSHGKGRIIPDRTRIREVLQELGLGPDFSYTSPGSPAQLDYIHRRTLNSDIYFVSNTQLTYAEAECTFRVPHRLPRFWHADTGVVEPCAAYARVDGGMKLRLRLPPAGSVFVVFSGDVAGDRPEAPANVEGKPLPPLELAGPWEVRFPPDRGAPASCIFERLVSWTEMPDDGIKYFSGTATYRTSFEVSEAWLKEFRAIELSLGEFRHVAEATLNGRPLGILWKPPHVYDATGLLKPGRNELKIEITNVWANRLVGDEKLPREKRVTRMTQKLPVQGPHPSGLFGPVELRGKP